MALGARFLLLLLVVVGFFFFLNVVGMLELLGGGIRGSSLLGT